MLVETPNEMVMVRIIQWNLHWCGKSPCYRFLKFCDSKEQEDVTFFTPLTCNHQKSDIGTYIVYIGTIIEAFSTNVSKSIVY